MPTIGTKPSIEEIKLAAERIQPIVLRTPIERSRWLSTASREIFLKLECLQRTGSFKLRGAAARLTTLTDAEKRDGILTVSAGNHGLAVAHCSEALGLRATIVVPCSASRAKVEAIRRYGATLVECGSDYDEAEREARLMERETGVTFVSPYNDVQVIAGQGTVALEALEDQSNLEALVVPVGGGGLIAGIAIAAKSLKPSIKIYGVEPETSPTMTRALEAGEIVHVAEEPTIADGLAGNIEPGSITFGIVQQLVDDMILVSEESIKRAMTRVASEDHLLIEGSSAAAIAALDDPKIDANRIGVIVTGRNITLDLFRRVAAEFS
jgi:threonine dehydratase